MPDVITTKQTLDIDLLFVDTDTRKLSLKNPKQNITSSDIENLQTMIRANNLLIGDKYGSAFGSIKKAVRTTKTTRTLDTNQ